MAELVADARPQLRRTGRQTIALRDLGAHALLSVAVEGAVALEAHAFRQATERAYLDLLALLTRSRARHPLRIWNFIPRILEPLGDLPHRYMEFNRGRFAAYARFHESPAELGAGLATASGTGHRGADLVIHCLAAEVAGTPVENPRQTPAYQYSERYGPRPPCFARAVRVSLFEGRPAWLLVGGTASVRGEDSAHPGDLEAQLGETVLNLATLVRSARPADAHEPLSPLERFRHLRVYFSAGTERSRIAALVAPRFRGVPAIEYLECDLCRPELLVEIEGLAEV